MLFERQKQLLALIDVLGGEVGRYDLQKLLFLFCAAEENPAYEFVPYQYGAFSFTSYADKRRLNEQGLLIEEDKGWRITEEGRVAARVAPAIRNRMQHIVRQYQALRGDSLIAETYRLFPYHAIKSKMAARLLAGDPVALQAIEEARPKSPGPGICTIGYEGRTLESYINRLIGDGVTLLCDVRRNPLSRKYGFSKKTLSNACQSIDVRYEHLPELGIAAEERRELKTQADYDALFASYESNSLPNQGDALSTIVNWVKEGNRVALTCYELHPHQCHRHCVAEALQALTKDSMIPTHL